VTWTEFGNVIIPMSQSVRVGLAVTSHNNGLLNTGVFDSLTVID
jgi:hypothetical protein